MISAAITAGIAAVLSFFGIPPGPYVAGVYIGVKITLLSVAALLGWRMMKKKRAQQQQPPPQ
jgi:hypothetical protein